MARGAGEGRLFEGGDCYKYFRQRGGGEGRVIIRGTAIIRIKTVSCYLLPSKFFRDNLPHWLGDFARLLTVQFTSNEGMSNDAPPTQRGGMLRISSDGVIEWGQKPKPQ